MPANELPKLRPHPAKASPQAAPQALCAPDGPVPPFAELAVTSNYTFLTGASHPEEFVSRAASIGYRAIALTDLHTLAGIIRAHVAAKQAGIQLLVGARIVPRGRAPDAGIAHELTGLDSDIPLLLFPTGMPAYRRLCRLLTVGKRRAPKGQCHLNLDDVAEFSEGLLAVMLPPDGLSPRHLRAAIAHWRSVFDDDRLSLAVRHVHRGDDEARIAGLARLAAECNVPLVAVNDALCHDPVRAPLQDVLTCIRLGCTLSQAGRALQANTERHLKPPHEMHHLFARWPGALTRTMEIARRVQGFSLDQLRYEYPDEVVPQGKSPQQHLEDLTWIGAAERYPGGVPDPVAAQIRHELALIAELNYAPYFLTVHDLVLFARSRGILCQGRGAAANSAVCYCLAVTAVDPSRVSVLFERFVSKERNEPPDIDIDFEHERREEVIQYIYTKYGRERAALTAEVITYRRRSAIRDVGKALGLSLDLVDRLAKDTQWWDQGPVENRAFRALGLNPADPALRMLALLTAQIVGFPRHLSQHVGGFVITRTPLCELVPIENAAMPDRTVIEWDKDDVDAAGMLKVDCLGLGMLTCVSKCLALVNAQAARATPDAASPSLELHTIPAEDPAVYDMICRADTIGVFQIESRAQMSMLPRLRPRCYYDLVIEVAIVRPGPIQGDMVHPYLRRRNREEPIVYPDERVKQVLGRTLGVPLFQEQCMALAITCAGFTAGEADQLRRAMAAWKRKGDLIYRFGHKIIEGMTQRGYDPQFAQRVFEQIKGFSEYGFPESHAASFALIVYTSAYLKHHHPAAFAAALINSQPMGFYAPAQIVRDAREHGVDVLPVDVNASAWDCTLEPRTTPALRLGMRLVRGLSRSDADAIAAAVARRGPFHAITPLWRASGVRVAALRRLASADAFASMGRSRQQAQWEIRALCEQPLPLFESAHVPTSPAPLPPILPRADVERDYHATGLSLRAHPLAFMREALTARGVRLNAALRDPATCPAGERIAVSGIVLVRQRPGTASGIVFITLEDESGIANLIVRPRIYERYRRAARHSVILIASGRIERQGEVVHVLVSRLESADTTPLAARSRDFH